MSAVAESTTIAISRRQRIGRVVANTGRDVVVMVDSAEEARRSLRLGDMLVIGAAGHLAVGVVSAVNAPAPGLESDGTDLWLAQVELAGSLVEEGGKPAFRRGVSVPPALGDVAYSASSVDLRRLFRNGDQAAYPVGTVLGQNDVAATVLGDELAAGGFAIIGGRGAGKSCTLASLVRALLRHRHPARTLLIDPFSEFGNSFGRAAVTLYPNPGMFPHWLLSFDELCWVLSCNGGALDDQETAILEVAIPAARLKFVERNAVYQDGSQGRPHDVSVEGPVPYRVSDLIAYIEKNTLANDTQPAAAFTRLRHRIGAAVADPRLAVVFGAAGVSDSLSRLVRVLFSLDPGTPPMAVLSLGGLTAGLDKLIVSVVARLAAARAEWGMDRQQTLVLLDEACRYAPEETNDRATMLSRNALRALGGRARKMGTSLGLVTRRPRTIARDVVGSCGTFFLHRLTAQVDVEMVEDLLPDAATAFMGTLGTLGVAEVIGVGDGVPLAGRLRLADLPPQVVPRDGGDLPPASSDEAAGIDLMINRWRSAGLSGGATPPTA